MLISQLIERLQRLKYEQGDIEICDRNDQPFSSITIVDKSGRVETMESVAE